jgi:hypothetical protein
VLCVLVATLHGGYHTLPAVVCLTVQVLSASEQGGSLTAMKVFRTVLQQQGVPNITPYCCCMMLKPWCLIGACMSDAWHGSGRSPAFFAAGARGFTAGLAPRLLTIVPGNMISWLVYEELKRAWHM